MNPPRQLSDLTAPLKQLYPDLRRRYGVSKLGIFGSYARHEQTPGSDLDLLVAFDDTPSLFKFIELENLLSDTLGIKVDLVMEDAIKPHIRERILREVQIV